jgi:type IV pilus assembly protein PilQ
MEEMMKKHKFILTMIIIIFLFSFAYAERNKIISVNVEPSGENLNIIFKSDLSFTDVPDFFENKKNSNEIVLRFKSAFLSDNLNNFKFKQNNNISEISFEKDRSDILAHIVLQQNTPFRIYKKDKNVILELYNSNSINTSNTLFYLKNVKTLNNDNNLLINFIFKNGIPTYDVFYVENPRRLVIDLYDTYNRVKQPVFNINSFGISRLRVGQNKIKPENVARVVLDLNKNILNYNIDEENNKLVMKIVGEPILKIKKPENIIKKRETIKINKAKTIINEKPEIKLEKKVIIKPKEKANTKFEAQTLHSEESGYKGALMSLTLKDADIRDVLRVIAVKAGLNLIIDPGITGKVTCELVKIPWDQALDLILKSNKLGKVLEGNVLRVGDSKVLASEEDEHRKLLEAKKLSGPIKVLTRTLSYAKVDTIRSTLKSQLTRRGNIIIDKRTNTLIISDVKSRVDVIDRMMDILDTPNLQVNIKARIVETNTLYAKNLGIQWGFNGVSDYFYGNQTSLKFPNNFAVSGNSVSSKQGIYGPLGGYAVNLPAPAFSSGIGISLGNVLDTFRLDAALTALQKKGKAKILSMPEITTQDNVKADIIQGKRLPVQTNSYNTISVKYVTAALELHVTPHVTAEGTILMNIVIRNDHPDFSITVKSMPLIITQMAKTSVMVKDGGTAVIGGMYKVEDTVSNNSVPGLGKLPIIGFLFKGSQRTGDSRELLIFITPRIVK